MRGVQSQNLPLTPIQRDARDGQIAQRRAPRVDVLQSLRCRQDCLHRKSVGVRFCCREDLPALTPVKREAHDCEIAQRRAPGMDVLKSFGGRENSLHQKSVGVGDNSEDD